MKYSVIHKLQPADRIVKPLFQTGLSKHHAIFLGEDSSGEEWVAENHYPEGVRIVRAKFFFQSSLKINRIEKFIGSYHERNKVVERALNMAGKPYNLITYNCEHYANEVLKGRPESKQVQAFLMMAISLLFLSMINSK